ncbi:gliding motility protein RemB [Mucilaginibacter hurinus]|uniref:Gliding motility protein RemB n=1 Tax=Mucilaginibacter hurinus TaxID=2201324 RepID=A0A367GLG6_9SPHI|nr:gliding motility protein RemB [Mucilaginibacter hurinus]
MATIILFSVQKGQSQSVPMQYQYQFYQKFNAEVYSIENTAHTASKPFLMDEKLTAKYDSLMTGAPYRSEDSWLYRKIFNEHLFDVRKAEYTFYADPIVDLQLGRDISGNKTTWLNARGFQLGGTIGDKFSFYSSGFENQGRFAKYYDDYVNQLRFVQGQAYDRKHGRTNTKDWSYVTAIISYSPIKQLNFTLGQDKLFIGDGYRSLLLSDYAANYPFFKTTLTLGPVQYTAVWANMQDSNVQQFDVFGNNRRKWTAVHYFDWNITNRLALGFYNAYTAPEADNTGKRRGFDANFINPLFFASSIGPSSQPGNSIAGFTGRYKFVDKHAVYGQVLLDKAKAVGGETKTTTGWQAGVRGADLLGVRSLNYLVEYNKAEPNMYTGAERLSNFTQFGEPLAHPLGNDFNELLGILNYSAGRFDFQGQLMYAKYNLSAFINKDGDLVRTVRPFINSGRDNYNTTLNASMHYAHGTISFLVNPRTNLRVEIGGLYRREKSNIYTTTTTLLTFGIRSSFRNLYQDF